MATGATTAMGVPIPVVVHAHAIPIAIAAAREIATGAGSVSSAVTVMDIVNAASVTTATSS